MGRDAFRDAVLLVIVCAAMWTGAFLILEKPKNHGPQAIPSSVPSRPG